MAISMLKIRRPLGRLIFNMGIAIPGKTVFLIETAPSFPYNGNTYTGNHRFKLKRLTEYYVLPPPKHAVLLTFYGMLLTYIVIWIIDLRYQI